MQAKKRQEQIKQRRTRRRKMVSFQTLSLAERRQVEEIKSDWIAGRRSSPSDLRNLKISRRTHDVKIKPLAQRLSKTFPGQKIEVLDEGAGRSSVKVDLMELFGENVNVTTTDLRPVGTKVDKVVGVVDLVKQFGKGKFHLVISTFGGVFYSPVPEKALFQVVSLLKPGGIGLVKINLSQERLSEIAKTFNINIIQSKFPHKLVFVKNFVKKKKRKR